LILCLPAGDGIDAVRLLHAARDIDAVLVDEA
jgi:hypothetical protein